VPASGLLEHAEGSRSARHLLECLLGRPVHVRTVRRHSVTTTDREGFAVLGARGVLLGRDLLLSDSRPPHLALALSASLVVPRRLPRRVLAALVTGSVPLDRLLDAAGVPWAEEVLELEGTAASEASFPVAAPGGAPLVRMTRRLHTAPGPVALVLDEVLGPPGRPARGTRAGRGPGARWRAVPCAV